jgi:hypothetical protein
VIVGLPDAAVKESRDRVMTGPTNSGFSFTFGRTVINLAPADVKKEGLSSIASAKEEPRFDLPIAIGTAAANEWTEADQLEDFALCKGLAPFSNVKWIWIRGPHGPNPNLNLAPNPLHAIGGQNWLLFRCWQAAQSDLPVGEIQPLV